MAKKSSSKKPAPVPENRLIKYNGASATPKTPGHEIYENYSTKKRKNSEQEKAEKQVEDESAKANKLRKLKSKKLESKDKDYLDTPTRPREKTGDGFFVYTAEDLVSRKADAGGLQRWNAEVDKCFLDTCIQEVNKRGRRGGSLHTESWITIMEVLKENHNFVVSQRQMKNRYDYLKSKYQAWLTLKTSHVYDHRTNTINMKNSEWQEYIKAHPKAKTLRHAPLLYPDLCTTLFEGTIITGVDALGPNSKDQDLGSASSSSNSRNVEQLDNDDVEADEHEGNSNPSDSKDQDQDLGNASPSSNSQNVQQLENGHMQVVEHDGNSSPSSPGTHSKASIPPSQGDKPEKKKKYQPSSSQPNLQEAMSYALSSVLKNHRGPSVTDCIAKLNEVGLDTDDELYLSAVVIFGQSEGHREAWMNLPKDNVRLLTAWIKKVGHIMGLTF